MNRNHLCRNVRKKIMHYAVMLVFTLLFYGCSLFSEKAPLEDGLFLSYDLAGSLIRVAFSEIDEDKFYATLTFGSGEDAFSHPSSSENRKIVDKRLKTERRAVYEAGILGPVWIPSSSVKNGGNAHGDTVSEVREWEGWEVGVVKASFGRGALQGEWYYEKTTGFLVGGMRSSVINDHDGGTYFILNDTNLEILKN